MKKLLLLPLCISLITCATPAPTPNASNSEQTDITSQLQIAEAKWQQTQPAHYVYRLQPSCYCPQEYTKAIEIEVLNGLVQHATLPPSGTMLASERKNNALTVNDLFALIHKAIGKKAAKITVQYDAQYGYPTSIAIDWEKMMADEETYFTATNLVAK
jgi:Family of unknown function (DUF6174)